MTTLISMARMAALVCLFCSSWAFGQSAQDAELATLNSNLEKAYTTGKFDDALTAINRIIEIDSQKYGKTGLETADALKTRGLVQDAKGDVKHAIGDLEEAVDIYKKHADLDATQGASFAGLLERLASIKMRESLQAGQGPLELALKWREKSNGPDAAETAKPLASLANIRFWNREYPKAAEFYKRALLILLKSKLEPGAPDRATVLERTRCTYRKARLDNKFAILNTEYEANIKLNPSTQSEVVSGGQMNGKAVKLIKPSYSAQARQAGAEGAVNVEVLISESGDVLSACAKYGSEQLLVDAAELAAYGSKFSPSAVAGRPVKVSGTLTFGFVR